MRFQIPQFEFKHVGSEDWKEVPEITVFEKLVDKYGRVIPLLTDMMQGKEIVTADGVFRMKICGNEGKHY
jgi:hypothetical protein